MKKIKQWKNFGKVFEAAEDDIIELEDVCAWMSDRVDSLEIRHNGEGSYNINIAYNRQLHSQELSNIVQNAEEMNELTKEYTELILRFDDMGYKVSYHLLKTTHHMDFYSFNANIQLRKQED